MIIPWQVDVPQDKKPVANWLIVVACFVVAVLQVQDLAANESEGITEAWALRGWGLKGLLGYMWLHGGFFHLLGNMWFLWIFGNNVEDRLGGGLYLTIYLLGGVLASGCHWMFQQGSPVPVIGASGAVAAILGAYAVTWPWARVHTLVFLFFFVTIIDLPALLVLGVWFIGQLLSGLGQGQGEAAGVAWWAHIGGFLAGMLLMPLLESWAKPEQPSGRQRPPRPRRPFEPDWDDPPRDPRWPRDRIIDVRLKDK